MGALTLSQLNTKEWARGDKWNVRFTGSSNPAGYTNWLPATDVTLPLRTISSYEFTSGHRNFGLAKAMDFPSIAIVMMDDDKRTITKFMKTWYEKMFPNAGKGGVAYLTNYVKTLEIETLSLQNETVTTEKFIVYPEGSSAISLNSNPGFVPLNLTFRVVGYYPEVDNSISFPSSSDVSANTAISGGLATGESTIA